jgi:hypothetical protein
VVDDFVPFAEALPAGWTSNLGNRNGGDDR